MNKSSTTLLLLIAFFASQFASADSFSLAQSGGIPSFESIMYKHRQDRDINNFLGALHTGRYEAMRRSKTVMACPSSDGTSCDTSLNWHAGWIMFVDENSNGLRESREVVLWVEAEMEEGFTLVGSDEVADFIRYAPDGEAIDQGTFTICDPRGASKARAIIVNSDDRPHTSFNDANGGSLTCNG